MPAFTVVLKPESKVRKDTLQTRQRFANNRPAALRIAREMLEGAAKEPAESKGKKPWVDVTETKEVMVGKFTLTDQGEVKEEIYG